MGMWSDGQTIWVSSLYQLWRLENALLPGQSDGEFDRLYIPQVGYTTGDIDVHDIGVSATGEPVFANTLFSCLATASTQYSFKPLWQPPFVSELVPEDRCHLNGLAMQDGRPRYVTVCAQTDVAEGWRAQRSGGGVVVDVDSGEIVCEGLSMPHSPRLINGELWLLDSGSGYLGRVDLACGKFEPMTFCAGYARGLAVTGHYALVTTSKCRQERTFSDLPLEDNLSRCRSQAMCGVLVVDLTTGEVVHWLQVNGVVEELYDVVVLPATRRPKALGFKTDEIQYVVLMPGKDGALQRYMAQPER